MKENKKQTIFSNQEIVPHQFEKKERPYRMLATPANPCFMKDTIGVQNIKMSCTTLDKSVTEEETPPLLRRINTFGSSNLKVLLIKFKLIQFNPALMKNQEVTALRQPFFERRKDCN
jgi:hypothetical protein